MTLSEYKANLQDIGLEDLKSLEESVIPRYIDSMFVEQNENLNVYLNENSLIFNCLSEEKLNHVVSLVEQNKFGSALSLIIKESSCKSKSLDQIVNLVDKINDNLYLNESEILEDWAIDVTKNDLKRSKIKNMVSEGNKLFIETEFYKKKYIIEVETNKALINRCKTKFNLLGENYSKLILAEIYNVTKLNIHKSNLGLVEVEKRKPLEEAPMEYSGTTAITSVEKYSDNVIKIEFLDKNSVLQSALIQLDPKKLASDEETLEGLVSYTNDIIEAMVQEDNFTQAVNKSKEIYSEILQYATPKGITNRRSTKEKRDVYSQSVSAQKKGIQVVPVDIDVKIVQSKEEAAPLLKTGEAIIVDDQAVWNYHLLLAVASEDGSVKRIDLTLKDKLKSFWSLEDWFSALLEELPDIPTDGSITFQEALQRTQEFMEQIVRDAVLGDVKPFTDWFSVKWKQQEDAGCMQVGDVPAKVDQDTEVQIPTIAESIQLEMNPQIVDLISRGFEPDNQGYLKRFGKYLMREGEQLTLKTANQLWNDDGSVKNPEIDLVHIAD